jgi:hypothetical protein
MPTSKDLILKVQDNNVAETHKDDKKLRRRGRGVGGLTDDSEDADLRDVNLSRSKSKGKKKLTKKLTKKGSEEVNIDSVESPYFHAHENQRIAKE